MARLKLRLDSRLARILPKTNAVEARLLWRDCPSRLHPTPVDRLPSAVGSAKRAAVPHNSARVDAQQAARGPGEVQCGKGGNGNRTAAWQADEVAAVLAWWLKVENSQLWGGLRRALEAIAGFQDAPAALWGA